MRIQSVATDGVAWFVSVTVGHDHQLRKMAVRCSLGYGLMSQKNHVLDGNLIPSTRRGTCEADIPVLEQSWWWIYSK